MPALPSSPMELFAISRRVKGLPEGALLSEGELFLPFLHHVHLRLSLELHFHPLRLCNFQSPKCCSC